MKKKLQLSGYNFMQMLIVEKLIPLVEMFVVIMWSR